MAEAAFSGHPVSAQDLVLGQAAVDQGERSAIEALQARTLVRRGKSRDLFLGQADRRLLVAALRGVYCRRLVGRARASRRCERAGAERQQMPEGMHAAATTVPENRGHVRSLGKNRGAAHSTTCLCGWSCQSERESGAGVQARPPVQALGREPRAVEGARARWQRKWREWRK